VGPPNPSRPGAGPGPSAYEDVRAHRRAPLAAAAGPAGRILVWFVQRSVLYRLTQTPMIALTAGFIFKWTTYPLATTFTVLPCLILLPAWILYRRRVSTDPADPANQFPRLALWALFPVIHSTWPTYRCTTPSATCSGAPGSASAAR
jgi:hypothetical protein